MHKKIQLSSTALLLLVSAIIVTGLIALAYMSLASGRFLQALNDPKEILEVTLTYDAEKTSVLSVSSLVRKYGFIPKFHPANEEYTLALLDENGIVVDTRPFSIPNEVDGPPPENDNDRTPHHVTLDKVDFTLNLAWDPSVKRVAIVDKQGTTLFAQTSDSLAAAIRPVSPPTYQSLLGSEYLSPGATGTPATVSSSTTLDIAFIGEGYTTEQLPQFHQDVDRMVNQILAVEPFKSRASQIMLHYVDNTESLGCTYSGRLILCNLASVAQKLNSQAVPYDKALIIVNNANYGGAGDDPIATTYNGTFGPQVGLHELGGHAIGNLSDEYQLSMNEFQMVNCSTSSTMPASWVGLVAPADYTQGCNFPNYYRSSSRNLMNILTDTWFNVISQKAVNARLDFYAAPYSNSVSPVASITSPVEAAEVSGVVTITTETSDDQGVVRAELWKDGSLIKTEYVAPYTFQWSSILEANGPHTLQVKAYDVVGNVGDSQVVTVTSANAVDTTKPVVVLTSPAASTSTVKVGGWFNFYATATDDSGLIEKVELYKNGTLINTTSVAPYKLQWDTSPEATNVGNKFYVKAYDFSGNFATSSQVTVTLLPPPDTIAPVATLTKPTNGTKLSKSGSTTITGNATDAVGVKKIELLRNTTIVKTCTNTTSCSTSVSNSTFNTGSNTITIKAYDAANNMGSQVITVTK